MVTYLVHAFSGPAGPFMYALLVLLAFVDMVYEFLWAAAVGGCLYFAVMMYLRGVNHNEQARQPHPAS
jgi:hypothetical protein